MEIELTKKAPNIQIDHSKCTVPFLCKRCLEICPQAVLAVDAVKMERLKETDPREPGSFRLRTQSRFKCSGCDKCIEVCPVRAITIIWPQ